jgi:hypothetical protein
LHSYEDIPAMLGIPSKDLKEDSGNRPEVQGRALFYAAAIGTDPKFADVIIDQTACFDRQRQELESVS